MRTNAILNQVRISLAILAAAAVMVFSPCAGIRAKAADTYTITYEAGENGRFSNGSSENKVTYSFTHHDTSITKYSHTANIDDTGAANGKYASNLSTTDTVTIPGATKLTIDVWYSTESTSWDWLAIYPAGVIPSSSNYDKASISSGKLGGGGPHPSPTLRTSSSLSMETLRSSILKATAVAIIMAIMPLLLTTTIPVIRLPEPTKNPCQIILKIHL